VSNLSWLQDWWALIILSLCALRLHPHHWLWSYLLISISFIGLFKNKIYLEHVVIWSNLSFRLSMTCPSVSLSYSVMLGSCSRSTARTEEGGSSSLMWNKTNFQVQERGRCTQVEITRIIKHRIQQLNTFAPNYLSVDDTTTLEKNQLIVSYDVSCVIYANGCDVSPSRFIIARTAIVLSKFTQKPSHRHTHRHTHRHPQTHRHTHRNTLSIIFWIELPPDVLRILIDVHTTATFPARQTQITT